MKKINSTERLAVTTAEAAELLSVSSKKLRQMTFPKGPIRAICIGREHRYPLTELQRYLREGLQQQTLAEPQSA